MNLSNQPLKGVMIVTGCSGLIGSKICAKFQDQYRIIGFDRIPPRQTLPNMVYVFMDLESDKSVENGFEYVRENYGYKIACAIHLADTPLVNTDQSEKYDKITIKGTERILDQLKFFQVDQFIFTSTQFVYAPCPHGQTINEDSPILPKWDYPLAKIKAEQLIRLKRNDIPTVILRLADCYDETCHSSSISHQIQRIYEHQLTGHIITGNPNCGYPFLHLDDLVDLIWQIVQRRQQLPPQLTLLAGEDKTMSYQELQQEISLLLFGKPTATYCLPKWMARLTVWIESHIQGRNGQETEPRQIAGNDDEYTLDITRARTMLGWNPRRSIRTELPKMISSLKADPLKWYNINGLTAPKWLEKKEDSLSHHATH